MKKLYFLTTILFLGWLSIAGAQNFGFLSNNIWFSENSFFAGEEVRIYTVIFNGSDADVSGSIGFFDNEFTIGETNFSLARGGRVQDVWTDWTPTVGQHVISARIISASGFDGDQDISLDDQQSGELDLYVDIDTDNDDVGDRVDEDDDNDGLSDKDELALGSDPLVSDTDGDGLIDGEDPAPLIFNLDSPEEDMASEIGDSPIRGLANMINNSETGERVEETTANALNAIDVFRKTQIVGLRDKKMILEAELEKEGKIDIERRAEQADERNEYAEQVNEVLDQEIFALTAEDSGLPKLSVGRILRLVYWGFITLMLFVFENKIIFYSVFGLLGLKLLFMIFQRVFRRRS